MHKNCPVCGVNLEPEPGFYIGAMYISYAFTVAIITIVAIIMAVFFDHPPVWVYVVTVITAVILLLPLTFRLSRSLYLHWFGGIDHEPEAISKPR